MQSDHPEAVCVASPAPAQDDCFYLGSQSLAIRGLERVIAEIAPTSIPVLIIGESGSGKEVAAQRIHRLSRRSAEAFLKVMCCVFAGDGNQESDHGNGGGNRVRGLAPGGTVFLDEIGDLSLASQATLLGTMPDGDVTAPIGSSQARLISATTRNLEEEVRSGRFREELYYRLNGVCLRLPPLRHRKEDIPGLVDFFSARYAVQLGRPKPLLSSRTLQSFLDYSWPGNIRELENAVRKIVALGDEKLLQVDIETASLGERPSLKQAARAASRQAERELILKALERTHWNRKRAARELQISYKALLYKLKQIGLDDSRDSFNSPGERE